jgi:hypothetical protein
MQRNRFTQTITLADRLADEAERLRQKARTVPVGGERDSLLRKARQLETAAHVNEWLSQGNPWTADYLKITGELDWRFCTKLYREQVAGRRGRPETWRRTLSSRQPSYSAPPIVACSIAAGILATDMSDRATWLRS